MNIDAISDLVLQLCILYCYNLYEVIKVIDPDLASRIESLSHRRYVASL